MDWNEESPIGNALSEEIILAETKYSKGLGRVIDGKFEWILQHSGKFDEVAVIDPDRDIPIRWMPWPEKS